LEEFGRKITFEQKFFKINGTYRNGEPTKYVSNYSGYIGFQPWSKESSVLRPYSFLYQLKETNKIDFIVMAFFVELRDNSRFHSTIKFGGWDAIGLQGGADGLNLIKTRNKGTWDLRMKKFAI